MDLFTAFGSKPPVTVGYMKNSEFSRMEDDSLLLKGTLAGFAEDAKLLIELPAPDDCQKLARIMVEARMGKIKTLVIPDFSHVGFGDCWESSIMDIAELSSSRVRLISIRDQFDSDKGGYLPAITMLAKRINTAA